MLRCVSCGRELIDCPVCLGARICDSLGKFTCLACANTGLQCEKHGPDHGR